MAKPPARRRVPYAMLAVLAVCAAGIGILRPLLARGHARVQETSDIYVLPPPEDVVRLSLGYRAALADLLWSHVLVSQGLHMLEKRRYDNVAIFLDTINALDPEFRDPYALADTLITFQAGETPPAEARKARAIMERGVAMRPLDAELWLVLGQFVAFIAPGSYITDDAERDAWRQDGARMLQRAAELGGQNSNISWQAIGGAGILHRAGERDAAVRFLRRTLAVTDDEELKANIQKQLDALEGEEMKEQYLRREAAFKERARKGMPFVTRTTLLLVLGPPLEPDYCAGGARADDLRCAITWRDWVQRLELQTRPQP